MASRRIDITGCFCAIEEKLSFAEVIRGGGCAPKFESGLGASPEARK